MFKLALFVNGTEIIKFKAKDSEIVATPLCGGNISNNWSADNMKRTGFNVYVYDFRVDYGAIAVDNLLDIHKYLMKKNNRHKNVWVRKTNIYFSNDAFWL